MKGNGPEAPRQRRQAGTRQRDDAEAVAYPNVALVEEDPEVFRLALRDVVRAREGGLAGPAETAQLNREPSAGS